MAINRLIVPSDDAGRGAAQWLKAAYAECICDGSKPKRPSGLNVDTEGSKPKRSLQFHLVQILPFDQAMSPFGCMWPVIAFVLL